MDWKESVILRFLSFGGCPKRELIRKAVYGDLSDKPATREKVLRHLQQCPNCAYETLPVEKAA
jgi:hypothetical protein